MLQETEENEKKKKKNSAFISKVSSTEQGKNSGRMKLGAGQRREKLLRKRALPPHPSLRQAESLSKVVCGRGHLSRKSPLGVDKLPVKLWLPRVPG